MGPWSLSLWESYAPKIPLWFLDFPSPGLRAPKSDLATIAPKQKNYRGLTLTWQKQIPGTSTWIWEAGSFKKGTERRQHQKEVRSQNWILRGKIWKQKLMEAKLLWWHDLKMEKQNEHFEMGKPALASLSFSYSAVSATLHMKRDENEVMEVNEEC